MRIDGADPMPELKLQLTFDDGRKVTLPIELVARAVAEYLDRRRREPQRCPRCRFGRIGSAYCNCQLGRDLKRLEGRISNPVGGADAL
jgi:hypothetical protein